VFSTKIGSEVIVPVFVHTTILLYRTFVLGMWYAEETSRTPDKGDLLCWRFNL